MPPRVSADTAAWASREAGPPPPKFLGMIRKKLDKEVEKLVADELPKDLSWFNTRELERYLAQR